MTTDQLKEVLFSDKIKKILDSDAVYLFRETADFIIESYQKLDQEGLAQETLNYLLPLLTLSDFIISDTPIKSQLPKKIEELCQNAQERITDPLLINYGENENDDLLALIFFKHCKLSINSIKRKIATFTIQEKEALLKEFFQQKLPLQELSVFPYTFELSLDIESVQYLKKQGIQGIMLQDFTADNGYITPPEVLHSNGHEHYIAAIKRSIRAFKELQPNFPQLAKYCIPRACLQKMVITINLNQLHNISHPIAEDLWDKIRKVHPTVFQGIKKTFL